MVSILKAFAGLALGVCVSSAAFAQDASWAGGSETAAQLDELYAAAKDAGQEEVVIYGAYSMVFQPVWELFQKRFPGITVVGNPLRGVELMARVDAEAASGQFVGDMVMSGLTELVTIARTDAALDWQPPNIASVPERYHDPEGTFVLSFADTVGMVYNKDKLPESELPTSVADLTDPKYKGMVFDDPLAGAITTLSWVELYHAGKIDKEWMRDVVANGRVVPSATPFFNNVTTGSVKLMPWAAFSRYLRLQEGGAKSVGFASIPGLIIPIYAGTTILEGGPNTEATKLLEAWFLTPEAQEAVASKGLVYPLSPEAPVPDDWPKLDEIVEALNPVPPAEYLKAKAALEAAVKEALQ